MARKGSRDSISRQNLRLVNDKPLIHYVLQTALNFHDADVFVSTDSEEIKDKWFSEFLAPEPICAMCREDINDMIVHKNVW